MTYKIELEPSGKQFEAAEDVSILDSALQHKLTLPHSCKNGDCGTCKAKLIQGEVDVAPCSGLSDEEIRQGYILTCVSKAKSDLKIVSDYCPELEGIEAAIYPCKVASLDFPVADIAILKLRFPPNTQFRYLAGQYINLMWKGLQRSYSIANAQRENSLLELHIRHVPNGAFSNLLFESLEPETLMRLHGPHGTFFVHDSDSPIIFLAGGTGFAPVKAMVEDLIDKDRQRPIYIYWGSQSAAGLYSEIPKHWQSQRKNITYVPVVSGGGSGDESGIESGFESADEQAWSGRQGMVHHAVMQDFSSLEDFEVYACGSSAMIHAAKDDFLKHGLPAEHFYSDIFTPFKLSQ